MDKTELLEALEDEHQELMELLENLTDEELLIPGVVGAWSIKDTLAHLTAWEGQTITLLFQVLRGVEKPTTAHFGKETDDQLNQRWYEAGKDRPLEQVWEDWNGARKQTIRRVSEINEKDLTDPKRFRWMKGNPLTQIILETTLEHEEEHADQIREWLEKRDEERSGSNGSVN